jgi:hypothetical protein
MQQRGIPPVIVDWLLKYGATRFAPRGGRYRYFDRASRERIRKAIGDAALKQYHERLDCYAVVAEDETVVTVGHRYRRWRAP